jgi:hypothetical protein
VKTATDDYLHGLGIDPHPRRECLARLDERSPLVASRHVYRDPYRPNSSSARFEVDVSRRWLPVCLVVSYP